jgi:hypothetical protein
VQKRGNPSESVNRIPHFRFTTQMCKGGPTGQHWRVGYSYLGDQTFPCKHQLLCSNGTTWLLFRAMQIDSRSTVGGCTNAVAQSVGRTCRHSILEIELRGAAKILTSKLNEEGQVPISVHNVCFLQCFPPTHFQRNAQELSNSPLFQIELVST